MFRILNWEKLKKSKIICFHFRISSCFCCSISVTIINKIPHLQFQKTAHASVVPGINPVLAVYSSLWRKRDTRSRVCICAIFSALN